jgi:hypothetical protein
MKLEQDYQAIDPPTLERIAVVIDKLAPSAGAFAYGLDWARHLHLPLHGVFVQHVPRDAVDSEAQPLGQCAQACARQGVRWTSDTWSAVDDCAPERLLQGTDLCMVKNERIDAPPWENFLARMRREAQLLVSCPSGFNPITRALVVTSAASALDSYVIPAVRFCQAVGAGIVVLTLADSDRAALCLQDSIEVMLGGLGHSCEYDSLTGSYSAAAVVRIAQWRGCQLLVTRSCSRQRWLRWLRADELPLPGAMTQDIALIEMRECPTEG